MPTLNKELNAILKAAYCSVLRKLTFVVTLIIGSTFTSAAFAQEETLAVFIDTKNKSWMLLGNAETYVKALDINNAGQVVGYFQTEGGSSRAFITGPNGLGVVDVGIPAVQYWESTSAHAINDQGQVVWNFDNRASLQNTFISGPNGEGRTELEAVAAYAYGINNYGRIVGEAVFVPYEGYHAFLTGPQGHDIAVLDVSDANDINDAGRVVGRMFTANGEDHAFITGPNGEGITDLGTLGGSYGIAHGVNEMNQVVGGAYTTGDDYFHAFITGPDGVGMRDLGTLGGHRSEAFDINDAGMVVGWARTSGDEGHAFITGPDGKGMIDLNYLVDLPANILLTEATGINNSGQVIASASIVPEPEIYALMLGGLGFIGFMVQRRSRRVEFGMNSGCQRQASCQSSLSSWQC